MSTERPVRVVGVVMRTDRDEQEIVYDVDVVTDGPAYEAGDNEHNVWQWVVVFGQTDVTTAGGARFVEAARCQQRIADEVWAAYHGKNADDKWVPASAERWRNVQP